MEGRSLKIWNNHSFEHVVLIVEPWGINDSNAEEPRRVHCMGAIWVSQVAV